MQRQSNPRKSGVQPERPRSASTSNSSPVAGPSRPSRSTSNTIPDGTSDMQVDMPDAAEEDTQYLPKKSFVTTKGWTMEGLVERAPHFRPIPRVAAQDPRLHEIINQHEIDGVPLIIEGWHHHKKWPKELFELEWLREHGDPNAFARNVHTWADLKLPLPDLIDKLRASPQFATPDEKERLYGKDGECPQKWKNWLIRDRVIPSRFLFDGEDDFLQHLPEANKVETLMCYLGVGDTFTPFHKDLCASSGQNLMCYTEGSGSSFWFMTKGSDAARVADYFHELGQELDLESHVVTVKELEKAPFGVYVAEQTLGDLVLVPPRSCHQVINHGGITIKTSWSRMTLAGLRTALYHELPIYRRVCRPEIYRVKSNIYHALIHYTTELEKFVACSVSTSSQASLAADDEDHRSNARQLRQLLELFDDIIAEEYTPVHSRLPHVSQLGSHKDDISCDFCGADVFQSFFGCEACVEKSAADSVPGTTNVGDGIVICSSCYVEGRTCLCGAMRPAQCRPFSELLRHRDRAMKALENSGVEKNQEYIYFSSKKSQLLCVGNLNIFHAGCILQQTRCSMKDGSQIRSCRSKSTHPSHVAIASSVILCKGCHSGRCFSHVLEMNLVHSAEAILLSRADASDQRWHQHHKQSKAKFEVARPKILRDEEEAVRPDMRHKLVHLALNFRTSTAVNPRLTKHGWYDEYVQLPSIPIMTNPPKLKKLANIPDTVEFSPQTSTHEPRPDMQTLDHSSSPYDREPSPLTSIDSDDDDDEADDDANPDVGVNRGSPAMTPTISGPSRAGIVHKVIMDRATKGKKVFVLVPGGGRDNWPSRPDKPQARAPPSTRGDTEPAGVRVTSWSG
ncbi:hypothetical protein BV22DRAFT_107094 [Leucogyrophana mollusca]|uniref:Uncharacterized protein n=1 Tax=Leucogyrophana mollusca TaxID=85980 RepID=A0ACB8BUW8_9AGAM|nr:hypothetical protein BV22DRAFT_107094 [Leucogyrophana mollusca]